MQPSTPEAAKPARPSDDGEGREDPLRVLFCHYTSDVCGGSDRSLYDLVTHLPRDRFRCALVLKTGDPMADRYRAAGFSVSEAALAHPRRTRNLKVQAEFAWRFAPAVLAVLRAARRFRADVVHVNTAPNLQGALAARLARRPLVWHVREMYADTILGRMILGAVRRLADVPVANSSAVGARIGGGRVRVVPNGIDLGEYDNLPDRREAKRRLELDPGAPVVSVVGRLEPWKGQHVLIEAAPAILAAHPAARFLVVGGAAVNKPEYLPALRRRCEEFGIAGRVDFTGVRRDVPLLLAASDVLVLPSVAPEPFGRTLVEAMAARCPVVATAAGGPLEIVLDGETGRLVTPDSAGALAAGALEILADPDRARRMGEKGRARAFERYSLERLVRDMAALFEEVHARR